MAEEADIDGDGRPDLIVDWSKCTLCRRDLAQLRQRPDAISTFTCAGAMGFRKAASFSSKGYRIEPGKPFTMIIDVHHMHCGEPPKSCKAELRYLRGRFVPAYRPSTARELEEDLARNAAGKQGQPDARTRQMIISHRRLAEAPLPRSARAGARESAV